MLAAVAGIDAAIERPGVAQAAIAEAARGIVAFTRRAAIVTAAACFATAVCLTAACRLLGTAAGRRRRRRIGRGRSRWFVRQIVTKRRLNRLLCRRGGDAEGQYGHAHCPFQVTHRFDSSFDNLARPSVFIYRDRLGDSGPLTDIARLEWVRRINPTPRESYRPMTPLGWMGGYPIWRGKPCHSARPWQALSDVEDVADEKRGARCRSASVAPRTTTSAPVKD
jgi:hypothetical protein